jgi:hypothetical protein
MNCGYGGLLPGLSFSDPSDTSSAMSTVTTRVVGHRTSLVTTCHVGMDEVEGCPKERERIYINFKVIMYKFSESPERRGRPWKLLS